MTIECLSPPGLSDFELLREYLRHNSQRAFQLLYDRHYPAVYSICRKKLHDRHLAEDATQQVFASLASHAKNLTPGPLEGYLAKLALRICDKTIKARKTFPKHEKGFREALRIMHIGGCPDERLAQLEEFLHDLTHEQREILKLRYELGIGVHEIAPKTGLTVSAAYKRIERALADLRFCFEDQGTDDEYATEIAMLRALYEERLAALIEALDAGRDDLEDLIRPLMKFLAPRRHLADRIATTIFSDVAAERAAGGDLSKLDRQVRDRILQQRELAECLRQEEERKKTSRLSAKSGAD